MLGNLSSGFSRPSLETQRLQAERHARLAREDAERDALLDAAALEAFERNHLKWRLREVAPERVRGLIANLTALGELGLSATDYRSLRLMIVGGEMSSADALALGKLLRADYPWYV